LARRLVGGMNMPLGVEDLRREQLGKRLLSRWKVRDALVRHGLAFLANARALIMGTPP
jgi:hypothetical protein